MLSKETLIQQFQTYLDQAPLGAADTEQDQSTDLYDLFAELVALNNEVKRESRQVRNAMDTFKSVFDTLEESQGLLRSELEARTSEQRDQKKRLLLPLLVDMLSIRDGMVASLYGLSRSRPEGLRARLKRREIQRLDQIQEGQEISLRRLDDCLSQNGVHAIEAVGRQLDPNVMRAMSVESDLPESGQAGSWENGQVVAELRTGFTWNGELLRPAEVRVFKAGGDSDG